MSKLSRRSFVGNASRSLTAIAIGTASPLQQARENLFVHHVYFWLKNPSSEADRTKLIEGLKALSKVKTIQSFHIGLPADTNRDVIERSYAVSWLLLFKDKSTQDSYQTDQIHLEFIKNYSHLWSKVIVYDSVDIS